MTNENKKTNRTALFGSTRVLVACAVFIAMSIAFGKLLAFNLGSSIRISFENPPVLMAGILFGPLAGAAVGAGADIIGCIMVGYSINPVITAACAGIGAVSGLMYRYVMKDRSQIIRLAFSVGTAHIICSMIIKSIGLYLWYHTQLQILVLRIPLYTCIGLVEGIIIYQLIRSRAFMEQLERLSGNDRE